MFIVLAICALTACASMPPKAFNIAKSSGFEKEALYCLPASVKILQNELPQSSYSESIEIHSAIGEAESRQILIFAGNNGLENIELIFKPSPESRDAFLENGIELSLGLLGYSPVKKPGLRSFGKIAPFPDPVMPLERFSIEKNKNRIVFLTARVPEGFIQGEYTGEIYITVNNEDKWLVPVLIKVYPVELPRTSFLKTAFFYYTDEAREERYYGNAWTEDMSLALYDQALDFRFTAPPNLPWQEACKTDNWSEFDAAFSSWLKKGSSAFRIQVPFRKSTSLEELEKNHLPLLAKLDRHLAEKNWAELCYIYYFDEPSVSDMKKLSAQIALIKQYAPNLKVMYTYGINRAGEKKLSALAGIFVPNIHQFNSNIRDKVHEDGAEYWIYTCIGNVHRRYPDNFRIDWYGASHRALGWWLFKNKIDGYLYWRVDRWVFNPWETAETFPWANGDGMMIYPAPDKTSAPYTSLRLHAVRDSFEDYDLLYMLKQKTEKRGYALDDEAGLLSGEGLVDGKLWFNTDDNAYDEKHRRLLELLSKP